MKTLDEQLIRTFTFSYFMTMAVIVSFFPLYFDSLGYSKMQIGLISSCGPAVAIAANLFWGVISDRFQTIKKTIVAVVAGQFVMILLVYQSQTYAVTLALMAGFYFFQTPLSGLNDSQILLTIRSSGKSYASFRVMGSIGFAFAAAVFGVFLKHQPASLIAMIAIFTVALSLMLSFTLKDARSGVRHAKISFSGFADVFLTRRLLLFLLLILIISTAHRSNDYYLALYMKSLGAGQDVIGAAWMTSALSEIPVFFLLSRYGHRYKELPLLALASLAYAIRFWIMSMTTSPYTVIAVQTLHSVSFGVFLFSALRYMQQLVPDRFRATGQAVYNMTWGGFAGMLSGLIGGRLFDLWGGHAVYRFAAVIALAACLGFWLAAVCSKKVAAISRGRRDSGIKNNPSSFL